MENQQETIRFIIVLLVSSETKHDITYNFDNYFNLLPLHKKKINNFLVIYRFYRRSWFFYNIE